MSQLWIPSKQLPSAPAGHLDEHAIRNAVRANLSVRPQTHRASDAGQPLPSGAGWSQRGENMRGWLHRQFTQRAAPVEVQRLAADAFRPHLPRPVRLASDATSYYGFELVSQYNATPLQRQTPPPLLLAAMRVKRVDPGKLYERIDFLDRAGSVEVRTPGKTTIPMGSTAVDSSVRQMHCFHTGWQSRDWLSTLHQNQASYNEDAILAAGCNTDLETYLSTVLIPAGLPGLDLWGLADVPALRSASALVYGTAAYDDLIRDLVSTLQEFKQSRKGVDLTGGLICTIAPRILDRLSNYSNFAAGGPGRVGREAILATIQAEGYTVREAFELQDFGGSKVDAMILHANSENSLNLLIGMDAGPADTYTLGPVTVTEHAMITGGLVSPDRTATLIRTMEVS